MIDKFHALAPYSLCKEEKQKLLLEELKELIKYHKEHCSKYANILDMQNVDVEACTCIGELPFIPVRVFKEIDLCSVDKDKIFKVMTSSGTSNQKSSKIYLDKENAILQQKVLLRLLGDFVGTKRLPMLVIDSPSVIKNRRMFSARGATIMGLDFAARKMIFALNDDMTLNCQVVEDFLRQYGDEKFLIFGFTFMVWKHLFDEIEENNYNFDLSKGFLLTGGGWKKLESDSVSRDFFKKRGESLCGLAHYVDHYSMAEQSGCIYAECEYGHLHASVYSDVIPRRPKDFSECEIGEEGILQVVSVLPHSYPGNSLLTEDVGKVLGVDDCPCGRKGKYIQIIGRIKNAEIRGCSDTYASGL